MLGKTIYIDRDQCEMFNLNYLKASNKTICADVLLNSKGGDGYDQTHQDILKPLGTDYVFITRQVTDKPGWYVIGDIIGI